MIENTEVPRGGSTKAERHAFWMNMVNKYRASNLSRREFCKINSLSIEEFRRWFYRVGHDPSVNKKLEFKKEAVQNVPQFIAVTLEPEKSHSNKSGSIYLELPNQLRIQLTNDFNPQVLRLLLETLGVQSC